MLAIFCVSLGGLYSYSDKQNERLFQRDFNDFTQRLNFQFNGYVYVLNTFSAFINAQEDMSLDEMNRFCDNIDFTVLTGIDMLTYAKKVEHNQKNAFENAMQRFIPDFKIKNKKEQAVYYPITFVCSADKNNKSKEYQLYGKDVSIQWDVVSKAIDSAKMISSGKFIQDFDKKDPALPARIAIYDKDLPKTTLEQRRMTAIGSLGVGFKMNTIIRQVINPYIQQQIYFEIYNKKSKELIFKSDEHNIYKDHAILTSTIEFADVPWEIRGYNKNNYLKQDYLLMFTLFAVSIILLFYVVYLWVEKRTYVLEADIEAEKTQQELMAEKHRLLEKEIAIKEQFLKDRAYFFAQITHELKTPLNAILGFNELIKHKVKSDYIQKDKIYEYLDKSMISVNRLLELINNILDISKMNENCMQYNKEENNISTLLMNHKEHLQVLCNSKNITLQCEIQSEIPEFTFDKARWEQVFNNLISNAVKFSPKDTRVVISLFSDEKSLIINIKDQGMGIPIGQEHKIFQAFMQSTINEKDFKSGTGLGLPLVREILKAHHAIITAKNNENEAGTTFTISVDLTAEQ